MKPSADSILAKHDCEDLSAQHDDYNHDYSAIYWPLTVQQLVNPTTMTLILTGTLIIGSE